jgi:CheY-like chemotaxis protein
MMDRLHATMERQLRQMVRLIDDLLDVSRISRGKIELRRELVQLSDVVDAAVETSRPSIEAGGHQLSISLPPEPTVIDVDPVRMAQVLANLLNNAAKYSDVPGCIRLHGESDGRTIRLRVIDSGVGIPADMLGRVFDLFTQADRSRERTRGGLGIGLTLARTLVELHGGTVEAHSDGPGRGSEFVVSLPLGAARPAVPEQETGKNSGRGVSRRVLVADDNADAAATLALTLQFLGHVVRTAYDGQEALDIAREFKPSVMFLDLGMPKQTGFDVARRVRSERWEVPPLLVAVTGWGHDEDKRRSSEAGFDMHLVKPVDRVAVERVLASLESDAGAPGAHPRSSA